MTAAACEEGVLSKPQTESRSLLHLKELVGDGTVDLGPTYQREVVWNSQKQSYLIDSLRNHYYVPPIVFALRQTAQGTWKLNVVDGKQRLTSILKFYNNEIPSRPPKNSGSNQGVYYYSRADNAGRAEVMNAEERARFDALEMICVQYIGLTESQERELFQRMQMGASLTNSEKLHAVDSPVNELIDEIQKKCPVIVGCMRNARLKLSMTLGQGIYMLLNAGRLHIPSHDTLMSFLHMHELHERDHEKLLKIFRRVSAILEEYAPLILVGRYPIAPVEFLFFAVMTARRRRLPNAQHTVTFLNCHRHVREAHLGQVRTNSTVMATLRQYVDSGEADKVNGYVKQVIMERTPNHQLPKAFANLEREQQEQRQERGDVKPAADSASVGAESDGLSLSQYGEKGVPAGQAAYMFLQRVSRLHGDLPLYDASQSGGQIAVPTSVDHEVEVADVDDAATNASKRQRV